MPDKMIVTDDELGRMRKRRETDAEPEPKRFGIRFNPVIDAGHILVVISFVFIGVVAWISFQNRLVVVEEWKEAHKVDTKQIKDDFAELKRIIREDTNETRRDVREILIKLPPNKK